MIPLAAYADRLSVRPGERVRFHVSNATGHPVDARVVRVICADPNPAGPGIVTEAIPATLERLQEPTAQSLPRGSWLRAPSLPGELVAGSFLLTCRVLPTLIAGRDQVLIAAGGDNGIEIGLDASGHLYARYAGAPRVRLARPLRIAQWVQAWLDVNRDSGELSLGVASVPGGLTDGGATQRASAALEAGAPEITGPLAIAARDANAPHAHFNGRLEAPSLFARGASADDRSKLARGEALAGAAVAWDFSHEMASATVVDRGPHALHATAVNCPTRAVRSSTWRGVEMCWSQAPDQYAAAHFHDDDIDDCRWPAAFEWQVPDDARSSCYALYLNAGDAEENVPFFVVAARGRPRAKVAVLVSTFTYTVYGNSLRPDWSNDEWRGAWQQQVREWNAYPHNPGEHPEYGLSTYNNHSDGSGISIASWHRPMFNVRVGYITWPYPDIRASGLRHLPADSHLLTWLERMSIDYDLVSDFELHTDGLSAIEDYPVLMTGAHPEYHTRQTLDALKAYRDGGGRFCYMGGNGFYWKVALSPEKDGVIEIRRGEGGIRAWAAEPGEYYNQFDGEYGGLWRRNGRAPQALAGVGFTAQGNFLGSYYRKRDAASDPRAAWIFEGVAEDIFGNHGLSGHGAAGFELDRADVRLGTPTHALVLATSENHPPDAPWVLVPEESLTHLVTWPGEPAAQLIRADMTFFETPAGGAVFSTGSITFCGSLFSNAGDNDVSRIVSNVLNRFLDPTPFTMPEDA